jgi:hypothetical protein
VKTGAVAAPVLLLDVVCACVGHDVAMVQSLSVKGWYCFTACYLCVVTSSAVLQQQWGAASALTAATSLSDDDAIILN